MIQLHSLIQRKSDLLTSNIDQEIVMMDLSNNEYYGLNKIGSRIWQLIEDPISVNTLILTLTKEFDVDVDMCKDDVLGYLSELESKNLIQIN